MPSCVDERLSVQRPSSKFTQKAKLFSVALALILGAIGSIPLILLTPPFQSPDEVQHFYRAYQLSEFHIRAEVQNGVSGGTLPSSLPELVQSCVFTRDAVFYPAMPAPLSRTLSFASIPLNADVRTFVAFPGSAFYSPLPYIPQVLGIAVGRLFGAGPFYLLYLGRIFNCFTALTLFALAVYCIPFAEELVMIVGLLPMSLFLFASVSPDAAIIGCALLFSALSFSAIARGGWRAHELAIAALLAAVFCSVKPPYVPILLAGLVPGLFQRDKFARVLRSHLILLAIAIGAAGGWLFFTRSAMTSPLDGSHPSLQIAFIRHHPASFFAAILHTLRFGNLLGLYYSVIGNFGWLTVRLDPVFACFLPLVNFILIWSVSPRCAPGRSPSRAAWYLFLALASAFLIVTALYIIGAHVGLGEVTGLQGRYFIPILVLAGMAFLEFAPPHGASHKPGRTLTVTAAIIALQIIAMDATIIHAFQVL